MNQIHACRAGTNQAVLQKAGRRISSAKLSMQPMNLPPRTGAREWKFRVNQTSSHTGATMPASQQPSAMDNTSTQRMDAKNVTSNNNGKGTTPLRQNTQVKSRERQGTYTCYYQY